MTRRVDLNRWQPHIEEARRRGVSLKAYAAEQGVSLYSACSIGHRRYCVRAARRLKQRGRRSPRRNSQRCAWSRRRRRRPCA